MRVKQGAVRRRLARAVAYELGLPFYPWYVRSTSKAQEGLYTYDAILRLHDVQTAQLGLPADIETGIQRDPRRPTDYRRFGPLGKAFGLLDRPAVVLIDEIDKADVDFANDLLSVLDDPWEFEIPETGEHVRCRADLRPIVIITSNKEKGNLPAPFLRRCIYYFVEFPGTEERLRDIVAAHYEVKNGVPPPPMLTVRASERFIAIRRQEGLHKKPGTSEFLDWLQTLDKFEEASYDPDKVRGEAPPPYRELLFKLRADWLRAAEAR